MSSGKNYGRDYQAGETLKSLMSQSEKFYVLEPVANIELVKGIIGAAVYSMGISYHLHVFSLSQGHPTLIIYTGDYFRIKSDGLISFYGTPSGTIDFSKISVEQALEHVLAIEAQYSEACAHTNEVNKNIKENNDWTIKTLKSVLINNGILSDGRDDR
jgi:polysaccharide pyruvyl transferase WcaK-like protein